MAGMKVQVVEVDKDGNIDLAHLKALVRAGALAFLRSFDRNSGQVTAGYCRLLSSTFSLTETQTVALRIRSL